MEKHAVDLGVRKGAWTKEEDTLLTNCIHKYGEGRWHLVPLRAGLNRCRKSCRLRWLNYLNPNVKRGLFTRDEVDLIVRMHKLLGNRWTLIAGRIPGRTANDVKNFWNTHIHKKPPPKETHRPTKATIDIVRPRPRTLDTNLQAIDYENGNKEIPTNMQLHNDDLLVVPEGVDGEGEEEECMRWWAELLETSENENRTRVPFSFSEDDEALLGVDVWELVSMNNQ